jgi:hypothetical protein
MSLDFPLPMWHHEFRDTHMEALPMIESAILQPTPLIGDRRHDGDQAGPSTNGSALPTTVPDETYPSQELLADWAWIFKQGGKGALSDYRGCHIAVLGKTIVAASADADELRRDVAQRFGVHPERVVIFWNDGPDFQVSTPSWE